jgi:hypothetical protein
VFEHQIQNTDLAKHTSVHENTDQIPGASSSRKVERTPTELGEIEKEAGVHLCVPGKAVT